MYNLSGCVFIKDSIKGAFCLFESMYQLLPLVDEMIVMDLGSTDGTLEALKEIEAANPKIRVVNSNFYKQDAAVFADLANDLVALCDNPHILYFQADEIFHEDLIELTRKELDRQRNYLQIEKLNYSFWRVQLKYNFQRIKWFPHPVHRIGAKDDFNFVNDGMNTDKTYDAAMVGNWGIGHFMQWSDKYGHRPTDLPTNEMIMDVSLTGGFLDNIPDRRRMHLPFWGEGDVMPADEQGLSVDAWYKQQSGNQDWNSPETNFNIPQIMRYHLGRRKYTLRPSLLEALKTGGGWR